MMTWMKQLSLMPLMLAAGLLMADEQDEARVRRGELTDESRVFEGGIPYNTYQVAFRKGEQVTIHLTSDDFDTVLMVLNAEGLILEDDDGGGGTNSLLSFTVEHDAVHTLVVRSFSSHGRGKYELNWSGASQVTRIAPEEGQKSGEIAGNLPVGAGGGFGFGEGGARTAQTYVMPLVEGTHLQADVRSVAFDTFLTVLGPDGSIWLNDDWQGSTEHSRVNLKAPASGDYVFYVTAYGGGGGGPFTFFWEIKEAE